MLIGIFIPDKALALLGADAGLIGLGRNYVRIILIATPFFMLVRFQINMDPLQFP